MESVTEEDLRAGASSPDDSRGAFFPVPSDISQMLWDHPEDDALSLQEGLGTHHQKELAGRRELQDDVMDMDNLLQSTAANHEEVSGSSGDTIAPQPAQTLQYANLSQNFAGVKDSIQQEVSESPMAALLKAYEHQAKMHELALMMIFQEQQKEKGKGEGHLHGKSPSPTPSQQEPWQQPSASDFMHLCEAGNGNSNVGNNTQADDYGTISSLDAMCRALRPEGTRGTLGGTSGPQENKPSGALSHPYESSLCWEDESRTTSGNNKVRKGKMMRKANHKTKYGWRKYGQKTVQSKKTGNLPIERAYYKCTHPDCPVKKMEEKPPGTDDTALSVTVFGNHTHHVEPDSDFGQKIHPAQCTRVALEKWRWQDYNPLTAPIKTNTMHEQVMQFTGASTTLNMNSKRNATDADVEQLCANLDGWNVALVDDDAATRSCIQSQLKKLGATVTQFKDGAELIDHVRADPEGAKRYDACLLDELMPRINGSEALRELRKENFDVSTVIMSGNLREEKMQLGSQIIPTLDKNMRMKFEKAGADSTMSKPVKMDNLMMVLRTLHGGDTPKKLKRSAF